jgi:hypothetical protein
MRHTHKYCWMMHPLIISVCTRYREEGLRQCVLPALDAANRLTAAMA